MSKTETIINNLKINQGTYSNIEANKASIGENELIITDDKNIPIPSVNDNGKIVSVSSGDYSLSGLKTINSQSIIGSGDIDTKELFICTHGTTTFTEITTALSNNKLPICIYNDNRYYIYCSSISTVHRFASMQSDYVRYITVDDTNTWSNVQAYNLQLVSNKVTSISSSSTDAQYPSAKAVYNYAQPKFPTVTITLSQVISQDPVEIQLTQAQVDVFADNPIVSVDASELGLGTNLIYKSLVDISAHTITFTSTLFGNNYIHQEIDVDTENLTAVINEKSALNMELQADNIHGLLSDANKILKLDSDGVGELSELKTINNQSLFGSGNISIQGGGAQDLTSNTAGTLDSTAWGNLKSNHYTTISSPTMTGLDSAYDFVNIKLSINSVNQFVKLAKNTTNKYSGLFFIEESTNLYEITAYYNGTNIILRCATVY